MARPRLGGASFFQKLLLGYVAVGALLVAASTIAYYRIAVRSIERYIKADLSNELRLATEYFNRSFGARLESDLWFITSSPTLDAFLSSQRNELLITLPAVETLFVRATTKNSDLWRSIRFVNPIGREVVVVEGNRRIRDLGSVEDAANDPFGTRIRAMYREAKSSHDASVLVSRPFHSPPGQWGFLIGAPKLDPETHSFGGVVIIHCVLDQYLHHLAEMRYRGWPVAWVRSIDGVPILTPREINTQASNVFTFSEVLRLGEPGRPFLTLAFHNAPEVFSDEFNRIGVIGGTVGGAMMLFVIGLSLFMSRQFSKPLDALAHAADRLAGGDRSFQVAIAGGPEIQRLATSFNQMIEDLERTTVSKGYVDNILESMIDSLLVIDPEKRIKTVNRAACRLLGYRESELMGRPATMLFPDEQELDRLMDQAYRGEGFISNAEREYRTKDGRHVPILFSMSVLHGAENRIEGMVLLAQDITERMRLEKLVVQSEKMSAVGQLAAGVAHEINNPLGVILGYMEAIADDLQRTDPLWEPIEIVRREANRCKLLVQNLLSFSRERKPGFAAEPPAKVVEDALALVETQARVKGVDLVRQFEGPLAPLSMDRNQIEQVVINLCANALDAMPGGGTLTVGVREAGGAVEIHVTDTGTGIPAELQQKIFEPFFSTKEIGKGTGLGLSLVFDTVKKHGGEIDFKSAVGRGTTFIVRLPRDANPTTA